MYRTYATSALWNLVGGNNGGYYEKTFSSDFGVELEFNYKGSLGGDSGGPVLAQTSAGPVPCGVASRHDFALGADWSFLFGWHFTFNETTKYGALDVGSNLTFIQKQVKVSIAGKDTWFGECPEGVGPESLRDVDTDGDYIPDACDPCPTVQDTNFMQNGVETAYADSDYKPSVGPDPDGIPDICDACPTVHDERQLIDGKLIQPDEDGDGLADACDSCPYSDVRKPKKGLGDWLCCSSDAECGKNVQCVPIDPGAAKTNGGFAPVACAVGRCAAPHDTDGDGTGDVCDNCPSLANDQSDDKDHDGVGDVCDNCPGFEENQPNGEANHPADENNLAANGLTDCTSDADCVARTNNSESECVPAPILYINQFHNPVFGQRVCSKFTNSDADELGDSCDSCPNIANPKLEGYDLQLNCNVDNEIGKGVPYPFIGDACDPSPCPRTGSWGYQRTAYPGWVHAQYEPEMLSKVYTMPHYPLSSNWPRDYTPNPTATVGARFCECPSVNGVPRTNQECGDLGCDLKSAYQDYQLGSSSNWTVAHTWNGMNPTVSGGPSSTPGVGQSNDPVLSQSGEVPGVQLESPEFAPDLASPKQLPDAFNATPSTVWWDVFTDNPTHYSDLDPLANGRMGVFWGHVASVDGAPAAAEGQNGFPDWSNDYTWGFYGEPGGLVVNPGPPLHLCIRCLDPCPSCRMFSDAKNLIVQPVSRTILASSATGAVDITSRFPDGFVDSALAPGVTWIASSETDGGTPASGAVLAAYDPSGSTVFGGLSLSNGRYQLMSSRIIEPGERVAAASAAPAVDTSGPAPRSEFGAALSATENRLFIVGGTRIEDHKLASDVWAYSLRDATWSSLYFEGPKPEHVLAVTYRPDDRSLWIVDERRDHGFRLARILRLDLPQRMMHIVGVFPRAGLIDRVDLSNAFRGRLVLVGSSHRLRRLVGVELSVDGDSLRVERAFWHRGTLGLRASLTRAGLTLPLEVPGGVENAFVPAGEIDSWHGGVAGCL